MDLTKEIDINTVVSVVGFLLIFIYQKQKIGSLEKQLNAQKDILGNTKTFFDIFDLGKVKEYTEIVEKKVQMEMECQMGEIQKQLNAEQEKHEKNVTFLGEEFKKAVLGLGRAFIYVPRDKRVTVIERMEKGVAKGMLSEVMRDINEMEDKARKEVFGSSSVNALLKYYSPPKPNP